MNIHLYSGYVIFKLNEIRCGYSDQIKCQEPLKYILRNISIFMDFFNSW